MRWALVVLVAALSTCLACSRDDPTKTGASTASASAVSASAKPPLLGPADLAAASDAVVAYYAALAAKDCVTLPGLVTPPMSQSDCRKAVADAEEHVASFDRVLDVAADGRDPTAALVNVRLVSGSGPHEQLVRVKNEEGKWRIQP